MVDVYKRQDMETMTKLRDYLTSHGLFTTIRASRGEDIFAACGMLSTAKPVSYTHLDVYKRQ